MRLNRVDRLSPELTFTVCQSSSKTGSASGTESALGVSVLSLLLGSATSMGTVMTIGVLLGSSLLKVNSNAMPMPMATRVARCILGNDFFTMDRCGACGYG